MSSSRLLGSLALQNLGRRRARTGMLVLAVAIATGIVFTGATLMRSIEASVDVGFTRLGADLMVVPEAALTNITAALLTVEPTDLVLDAGLVDPAAFAGIARAAPQRIFRTAHSGLGHHETADLIGFDPATDFTVQPWIVERLPRPMQDGDLVLGAARDLPLGSEVTLFGRPHRVYGRLGRTGVGTHERGVFMSFATLEALAPAVREMTGETPPVLAPGKVTGFLVELAPGATELQVRFALLSKLTGIKVVAGEAMFTGIRQGLSALVSGMLGLVVAMFLSTAVMVSVLFSAIVTERRAELGLLKAIGARRGQIVALMLAEAAIATGIGGALGVVLGILALRLAERSLVYYLQGLGVPFLWLDAATTAGLAVAAVLAAGLIGALGALAPAWRASRRDAYDLIRGEG